MYRMTTEEIDETAVKLAHGRLVVASSLPPDMLTSVFMILGLDGLGDIDPCDVGNVYEDLAKAGPIAVNGYPVFLSCHVAHKDDWGQIVTKAQRIQDATAEALT